jgi:23S rRNA (cytosine1962-C5)-methyltransferase
MSATLVLLPHREKSLLNRHPWIFSGAVAGVTGEPSPGDVIDVHASDGRLLARGFYNPRSQIVFRALTWADEDVRQPSFWTRRIADALSYRIRTLGMELDGRALRVISAEADGLPGLIVDMYDGCAVIQMLCMGMDIRRREIVDALNAILAPRCIYERSDSEVRRLEGLSTVCGLVQGEEPPALVEFSEGAVRLLADIRTGHKTGFYLDQAVNRRIVAGYARGRTVLNCYSYTGAFGVHCAASGSSVVTSLDSSAPALSLATANMDLNGFGELHAPEDCDVPERLRTLSREGRSFGMAILDPPRFVPNRSALEKGARAYKDIARLAFMLLEPGGILATFSCSGQVDADLFQKIIFSASVEAGRDARIISRLGQAPDHPALLSCPEGTYLKGLLCSAV